MGVFSIDQVRFLMSAASPPCVSLYMPSHRAPPAARQDPIRLKNGLAEAEMRLVAAGRRRPEVEEFLQPAHDLVERPELWRGLGQGFALFLSPKTFQYLRLPIEFRDLVLVGDRFHLKPLLPLLTGDGRFYVLALSQNQVRLFEASRDGARELEGTKIPRSLEEGVNMDVKQHYFQRELRAPRSTSERSEAFDAMLEPFLQRVDSAVAELLGEQPPLVLAGVSRICTAYRLLSRYPNLVEDVVEGSPEGLTDEEIHEKAWQIVKRRFVADRERASARYLDLLGSGRSSQELGTVLEAAEKGRVETLFVPIDQNIWGTFQPRVDPFPRIVEAPGPDGQDLLDRAAVDVLLRRGTVYAVPRQEMPGSGPINAIFRY